MILTKQGHHDEARQSLSALRDLPVDSSDIYRELQDIQDVLAMGAPPTLKSYIECLQGTNLRRQLIAAMAAVFGLWTGIGFFLAYGTTFFESAGVDDAFLISLILAIVMCVFTVPSIYTLDRYGRRALAYFGGSVQAIALLLAGVVHNTMLASPAASKVLIACCVIFITAYAGSWGPVSKLENTSCVCWPDELVLTHSASLVHYH